MVKISLQIMWWVQRVTWRWGVHRKRPILFPFSELWTIQVTKSWGCWGDFPSQWHRNFTLPHFVSQWLHSPSAPNCLEFPSSKYHFMFLAPQKEMRALSPMPTELELLPRDQPTSALSLPPVCPLPFHKGELVSACGYPKGSRSLTNQNLATREVWAFSCLIRPRDNCWLTA